MPDTPRVTKTEPHSDAVNILTFDDGRTVYGCSWPGCHFVAEAVNSVGSHYKVHVGKAAQRRRGERKLSGVEALDAVETSSLSILDRAKELIDALDALEDQIDEWREKANKYDELKRVIGER